MWHRFVQAFTLAFFRAVSRVFPPVPGPVPRDPSLILVFSCTGIGDALFQGGAIRSLKKAYPRARIVVCAHHKRRTIALHHPDVAEVVSYGKSPLYALRLLWRFRRNRPDIVVLLNTNTEVLPLAYCINRRALFGPLWRSEPYTFLLSHPVDAPNRGHMTARMMSVAEAAGGLPGDSSMVYAPTEAERSAVRQRFAGWIEKPYLIFQTGGGTTLGWRNWPVEAYIRAIRWLRERYDLSVVLTGGHDNEPQAAAIESACPGVINLCSKTTLEETAALLTFARLLVSSDTGVMHLAFAVKCPTVSIHHYRIPASDVGPLDRSGNHEVIELARKNPASPTPESMDGIPDQEVWEAIERLLARGGVAPRPVGA